MDILDEASCSLAGKVYHCIFDEKNNDMSNLQTSYTKILALLHELEPNDDYLKQIRAPKLTDKQLIALNLGAI